MHDAPSTPNHGPTHRRKHTGALTVTPQRRALLTANGWETLDDLFRLPNDATLSKPGLPHWRERLRASLTDDSGRRIVVYVKRFHDLPLTQQCRRWWGGEPNHGTAWTEWSWLRELAQAGIPAPEPIAYAEELVGGWERRSAVVIGALAGISLERWCARHDTRWPDSWLEALAILVARFHALGIAHRDLYLSHIFGEALDTDAPRLSIIDLQRVVRMGRRRRRWIVKDLAALNYSTPPTAVSPRDRLRWLKRYLYLAEDATRGRRLPAGRQAPGLPSFVPSGLQGETLNAYEAPAWVGFRGRAAAFRLQREHRVLVRRIVGKTEQIRRHDARRRKAQ
ncbi:MAG: lipopolysaccharide kinase InaA family protein [Planctomycetota bacterium]